MYIFILQITDILNILAGILHLGNIKFVPQCKKGTDDVDPDGCDINVCRFKF